MRGPDQVWIIKQPVHWNGIMKDPDVIYREANIFSDSTIWLAAICMTFCSVYFALPPLFSIGSDRSPTQAVVVLSMIFIAVGFISPILLLIIKLRIQVRSDGLYVKIIPFHLSFRKVSLSGLATCVPYEPKGKERNKLGLRSALSKKAYSLGGKRGIQLEFADGRTVLLESKRPEKIIQAIKTVSSSSG